MTRPLTDALHFCSLSGPSLVDPLGAHVPISSTTAATQFHLVADFDAQHERDPHARTYDFHRWSVVVLFRTQFQNFQGDVLMTSCSLCEHTAQRHHLYARSRHDHEDGTDDAGDMDLDFIDDPWLVSLPPDFTLSELIAPCHHARVAITHLLLCADLDFRWSSYDELLAALLGVCTSNVPVPSFPIRLPHRKVKSLEVYSSSDRLYYVFTNVEKNGAITTYCSHCARRLRKGRACRHQRDFLRMDPEPATIYHAVEYERDDEEEEEDAHDSDVVSRGRYPCTYSRSLTCAVLHIGADKHDFVSLDDIYSDPQLTVDIPNRQRAFIPTMLQHFPGKTCEPEARICPSCASADLDLRASQYSATVFGAQFLRGWQVFQGRCRSCSGKIAFDGRHHGILNYKNRYLFPVELLNEFLKIYSRTGVAATAWWDSKVDEQLGPLRNAADVDDEELSRVEREWTRLGGQMCRIVAGFASLIDIPTELFACCSSPRAVAADGIVLSVRSSELADLDSPWMWDQAPAASIKRASTPAQRSLPCTKDEKLALEAIKKGDMQFAALQAALDDEQAYASTGPRAVLTLCMAHHKARSNSVICPLSVRDFVMCFTRTISPAIQLLPSALWPVVDSSLIPDSPSITTTLLETLTKYSPILSRLLTCARDAPRPFRTSAIMSVIKVIKDLRSIAGRASGVFVAGCFKSDNCTLYLPHHAHRVTHEGSPTFSAMSNVVPSSTSPWDELMKTGVYMPNHPIVRQVPHILIGGSEDNSPCTKHAKSNTHLGPGVILLWCVEHRCCIGFSVMTMAESPRTLYELLVTRFVKPPPVVIYDNGCNVAAYAMNRTPHHFRDTLFLSDGLHWPAHTNCAPTFDSARHHGLYDGSSVVHEQKNRDLAKLKYTSPHMKYRTFSPLLALTVTRANEGEFKKRKKRSS